MLHKKNRLLSVFVFFAIVQVVAFAINFLSTKSECNHLETVFFQENYIRVQLNSAEDKSVLFDFLAEIEELSEDNYFKLVNFFVVNFFYCLTLIPYELFTKSNAFYQHYCSVPIFLIDRVIRI
jgi:hypothetical protein